MKRASLLCHVLGGFRWFGTDGGKGGVPDAVRSYSLDWLCLLGGYAVQSFGQRSVQRDFRMWPLFSYEANSHDRYVATSSESVEHNGLLGVLWNYSGHSSRFWRGEQADTCRKLSAVITDAHVDIDQGESSSRVQLQEKHGRKLGELCRKLDLAPPGALTHESLFALAQELESRHPLQRVQNRHVGMLLNLVDYRKELDESSFKLLWGSLFSHKAMQGKTETTVLWRGFRQVTTPTQSSREVFPFISCYRNREDNTSVSSFAWRLYRRETSPKGNRLWLFFIPFQ